MVKPVIAPADLQHLPPMVSVRVGARTRVGVRVIVGVNVGVGLDLGRRSRWNLPGCAA